MPCPFCDVQTREPERIIRNNKFTFVILSNPRLMPGHTLVIPKRHVEKLSELNKEEREEFFDQTIQLQEKVLESVAPGCDVAQHYRPFIPNGPLKVAHLHFHILPRSFKDELYQKVQIHDIGMFVPPSPEEVAKFKELFKD